MKKKEITSLAGMKADELVKIIGETQKKLAGLMRDRAGSQSKNVREGRSLRRKIAVAKTMLHMKELSHE